MGTLLLLEPAELLFEGVRFHQVHSRAVRITNTTKASAEGEIKASSSDRYIISPSSFRLKPGEAADLTISLRLEPKFAQRRKAIEIGQRDAIFIKTVHFDQRLSCTFFLHPDEEFKGAANSLQQQPVSPKQIRPGEVVPAASPRRTASSPLRPRNPDAAAASGGSRVSTGANRLHSSPLRGSSSGGGNSNSDRLLSPRGDSRQAQAGLSPQQSRQLSQNACSSSNAAEGGNGGGSSRLLRWTSGPDHADVVHQVEPHLEPRVAQLTNSHAPSVPALKQLKAAAAAAPGAGAAAVASVLDCPAGPRRVRKSVSFADMPPTGSATGSPPGKTAAAAASGLRRSVSQSSAIARSSNRSSLFDGLHSAGTKGNLDSGLLRWERVGTPSAFAQQQQQQQQLPDTKVARSTAAAGTDKTSSMAVPDRRQQQLPIWAPCLSDVSEEPSQDGSTSSSHLRGMAADRVLQPSGSSSSSSSLAALRIDNALSSSRLSATTTSSSYLPNGAAAHVASAATAAAGDSNQQQDADAVAQLRAALRDAQQQLQDSQALVAQLQAAAPDAAALVETGRKQEQALQEERNRRALELLLQKDKAIQVLQDQLAAATAAQDRADAAAAAAIARADALQVALTEAGVTAAAELAAVQQRHTAAMAALEEKHSTQAQQLASASQQVLELSTQLALSQREVNATARAASCAAAPAAVAAGAFGDDSSVSLDVGVGPQQQQQQQQQFLDAAPAGGVSRVAGSCGNVQHADLLSVLAERDAAVAQLESQLAVARAALEGRAEVPGESGAVAQVVLLQRQLGEAMAELHSNRERLAEVQAIQALTEAAAEEGGLIAAEQQSSAGAAMREAARSSTEAQVARLTAARLNARVTALEGELAAATAAKEALQDELERQQDLSAREATLLRRKLSALLAAGSQSLTDLDAELNDVLGSGQADDQLLQRLQALQQQQQQQQQKGLLQLAPCRAAVHGKAGGKPHDGSQGELSPEALLASALEDAESTVTLLQSKLVMASSAAAAAEARVEDLQQRLTSAAVRRTREVASARAAGEVQLATLQDAVQRLGQRDDMTGQVASLSLDLANMKRIEVQLQGELSLAQQQLADTQQQLADARQQCFDQQQQAEATAISSTYPLMRAAQLLEGWTAVAEQLATGTDSKSPRKGGNSNSNSSRPWPCFDACKPHQQHQQQQQRSVGHALLEAVAEWTGEQRASAAAAAALWLAELAHGQQLLAAALQRAEQAEMELSALKLDRAADHETLCLADTPAASAAMVASARGLPGSRGGSGSSSPRQLGWQPGSAFAATVAAANDEELRRQLLAAQQELMAARAELMAARQQRELADVELSRLSAEVQASAAAAADAQGLLAAAEATAHRAVEAARSAQLKAEQSADEEIGAAQLRIAEADAAAAAAAAGRNSAEAAVAAIKQQAAAARAEASRLKADEVAVKQAAEAQALDARQQLAAKDRELSRLSSELDSQQMRACVLLETLETLQAGDWESEGQQRLVSLTAQVTAQAAQLAAAEQRCKELLADADSRANTIARLRQQLDAMQQEAAGRAAAAAAAEGANLGLTRQLTEFREQLKAATQQAARPARELCDLQRRLSAAEAEAQGLRAALAAAQERHSQHVTKLCEDAASITKDALDCALRNEPPHSYVAHVAHMTAALDSLVAAVQAAVQTTAKQQGPAAGLGGSRGAGRSSSNAGSRFSRGGKGARALALCIGSDPLSAWTGSDVSWVKGVVQRLKELLLESDRLYIKARLEADAASNQSTSLSAQLSASQATQDRLTALWQAAERGKQCLMRGMGQREAQAAAFAVDRMQAQDRHISMLFSQAQQVSQQLVTAQAEASAAQAAAAATRQHAATLSLQLEAALSEADALRRAAAAATQEAAGVAHWCLHRPAGSNSLQGGSNGSSDAAAGGCGSGMGSEESVGEALRCRDEGLIKWFEARVAGLVKQQQGQSGRQGQDEQDTRLMALVREVCGLKLVESQLLASLAAANARSDAATLRAQRLSAALETATAKLAGATSAAAATGYSTTEQARSSSMVGAAAAAAAAAEMAAEVARLQAQLLARSQEVYDLQDQLMQAKQLVSARELESDALQAELSTHSQATTAQQASDAAALAAQRAALTAAAAAEEARLRREIQELRQLLRQQSSASFAALDAERAAAAQQATESAAAAAESAQEAAAAALHAAEVRAALLEGQLEVAEQERDALLKQVASLTAHVDELQTSGDVSAATVQSLEATLAAIERAEARRAAQPGSSGGGSAASTKRAAAAAAGCDGGSNASSRRTSRASSAAASRQLSPREGQSLARSGQQSLAQLQGKSSAANPPPAAEGDEGADGGAELTAATAGSDSAAALSKEVVKAHTAAADAQRKLRVSARVEMELRQRLAERDARITQLKQDLTDNRRQADVLQRRVNELLGSSGGGSSGGGAGGPELRNGSVGGHLSGSAAGAHNSSSRVSSGSGAHSPKRSPRSARGAPGSQGGSAGLTLPLEWASESQRQQQQQQHIKAEAPSAVQIYGRINSGSSTGTHASPGAVEGSLQGLAAAEKEYLAHQIAALRISLAKRDADVTRLEGALAEAVAQQQQQQQQDRQARPSSNPTTPRPAASAPLPMTNRPSSVGTFSTASAEHLPGGCEGAAQQQQQQQQQQRCVMDSALRLRTGSSGGGSSKLGLNHSATAAARLGREASFKGANTDTAALNRSNSRGVQVSEATAMLQQQQQQAEEEHHMLAVQFAAASAQLASALATARQVLSDLVLGASPNAQQQAELEAELNGLNLEEAITEVVYQVHDKLGAAAAVAEAASAEAAAALAQAGASAVAAQQAQDRLIQVTTEFAEAQQAFMSVAPPAMTPPAQSHHNTQMLAQQQTAAAERAGLVAQAESMATAHADLAQQLAYLGAERESLAQQNAALAAALGDKLAGAAAASEAHTAEQQQQQQSRPQQQQQQQQGGEQQVSPAQLRELGALLQRLTKENAALIKARDAAVDQHAAVSAALSDQRVAAAELQAQLEATQHQASQLNRSREQLHQELAAARQQLQELGAAQDGLRAQVAGARAERDTLADQNAALARTTHQLMAGGTSSQHDGSMSPGGVGSLGSLVGPVSAPVSLSGAAGDGSISLLPVRPRALSEPASAEPGGAAAGGVSAAAQRITSGQLRDIGAMLARLTRENAALIKQRDKFEAAAAEAARAGAAAAAAVAEREQLLQERAATKAQLDAAKADYSKAAASVRQLAAERDRLLQQVSTLITERDSMASHNLTLANTTSRLMAASANTTTAQHDATGAGTTPFTGGNTWAAADSLGHGLFDSGFAAGQRSASAPGAPEGSSGASSQQASQGQGGPQAQPHRSHSALTTGGAVMSPSQAREIGALLTRLTNENTQFLKARDAAVASRNEALNRAAAVEAELELRQQEFRSATAELQRIKAGHPLRQQQQQEQQSVLRSPQQQQDTAGMSPQDSSASVGTRPQQQQQQQRPGSPAARPGRRDAAEANRLLSLCCTVQRSVSCAESVQAALLEAIQGSAGNTASSTEKHAVHQTNSSAAGGTAGGKASSPQQQQQQQQQQALPVEPGMLVHVLGAELAALKDAAKALSEQLQQGGTQQQQQQQQAVDFSFRTMPGTASEGSISLDGIKGSTQQPQQQQQQSATTGGGASAAVAAANGAVMVSPTVLQELQAAAQQQQRRCGKWKARCKQLAQQLSLLTAQWSAAQNRTLPAAAAVADDATPQQQQQQQQADADAAGQAAEPAGEPSAQHMAAVAAAVTAAGLAGLLSRLDEFETHLDSRLQQSLGASGALLTRAEGVAADVAATADALDGRVLPLLGCAAGLEAQIAVLDQKLQEVQQQHELAAAEQQSALAGAAQLQAQLDDLQHQLHDTSAAFAAEHSSLAQALAQAEAARDEARASAAAAVAELEGCRARLADAESEQARAMAELQTRHMSVTTELRRQLQDGASAPVALSAALRASEAARSTSDAALCQLADDMRAYQAAKQAEVSRLEHQLEALLAAAPASLAAQFLAATAPAAAPAGSRQGSGMRVSAAQGSNRVNSAGAGGRAAAVAASGGQRRRPQFGGGLGWPSRRGRAALSRHALSAGSIRVSAARHSMAQHNVEAAPGVQYHRRGGYDAISGALGSRRSHQQQQQRVSPSTDPSRSSADADSEGWTGSESEQFNQQQQQQQQQQQLQQELSQDVAALAAAVTNSLHAEDALSAALREARWQQLGRVKAETAAEALRASCMRLKARLTAARAEIDHTRAAAQQGTAAVTELPKLQSELASAREALKSLRTQQDRQLQQQRSALAALAATTGPGEGTAAALAGAAAAAAMACGSNGGSRGPSAAAGVPDIVQVLQLAQQQLCQQQLDREGLQAKLNEARAAIERKNTLIRDLKARLETLGAQLSNAASASALEERALAAEGRAKALAASLGRKDAALREAQAAATALKVQLSEAAQQAASGDVQAAAARLKAELGRKEAALQAATSNLEQIKQQLSSAQEASTKQICAADNNLRRQAARQQQHLSSTAQAFRTAAGLLLSCMATMAAAAGVLQQSMHSLQQRRQQQLSDLRSSSTSLPAIDQSAAAAGVQQDLARGEAAAAAAAQAAAGLADMVCLSGEELADLLGPEDDTCRMLLQELQQQQQQQPEQGSAAAADAVGGVAECLVKVRQGGSQALLELEGVEAVAQRQQQLQQQLEEIMGQLCSGSAGSLMTGSPPVKSAAAAAAECNGYAVSVSDGTEGSVKGTYRPGSASSRVKGGGGGVTGCVLQALQSVLQLLTQDVGAQQGALRAAVCLTVTHSSVLAD